MAVSGLLTELEDTTNDMDICAVQLSEVGSGRRNGTSEQNQAEEQFRAADEGVSR